MLFRIVNHHIKNQEMRDKLICINFLPEEFYTQEIEGHKVLRPPFEFDNEKNLPRDIRAQFPERMTVYEIVQPLNEAQTMERYRHDRRFIPSSIQIVKIDCATGPGEEKWKEVEKYIEKLRPASIKFMEPAIVGDQLNWTLEAEDVPVIDLHPEGKREAGAPTPKASDAEAAQEEAEEEQPETPAPVPEEEPAERQKVKMFNGKPICPDCNKVYKNMSSLRNHRYLSHKKKVQEKAENKVEEKVEEVVHG